MDGCQASHDPMSEGTFSMPPRLPLIPLREPSTTHCAVANAGLLGATLAEHWASGLVNPLRCWVVRVVGRWKESDVASRRNRRLTLAVALLLSGAACGPAGSGPSQPPRTAAPPAATARAEGTIPCRPSVQPEVTGEPRFTPPSRRAVEVVVLPVVFPDGSTAELRYPPELDLARSGVWPRTSGALGNDASTGRGLLIIYGNPAGLTAGKAPVACYQGADRGQVELWRSQDPEVRFWLLFRFGGWTVALWDGNEDRLMGHQDRAVWARSLVGRETEGGWLVLRGKRPLRLGAEHEGDVQLQLGDLSPRAVLLWPVQCRPRRRPDTRLIGGHAVDLDVGSQWFASYCLPKAPMEVHVYDSDGSFGRAVIQGLQVRNVRHAFPAGRYHIVP
jgi:hypothetical protein